MVVGWAGHHVVIFVERLAGLREGCPGQRVGPDRRLGKLFRRGDQQPAPVDPLVVSLRRQDRLGRRADAHHRQVFDQRPFPLDELLGRVDGPFGRGIEINLYVVRFAIVRADCESDIRRRTRQHLEIVQQQRRGEGDGQIDAGPRKAVNCAGSPNRDRLLLDHVGHFAGRAHEPQRLAIDANDAAHAV